MRILERAERAGVKLLSRRCVERKCKLAIYIANLLENGRLESVGTAGRQNESKHQQAHGIRKYKCPADGRLWEIDRAKKMDDTHKISVPFRTPK